MATQTQQDLVQAIMADLPGLPEEVAEGWLVPHAQRPGFGWPPAKAGKEGPWSQLLAGRGLAWWRERLWHCEPLPMQLDVMSHVTKFQVERLLRACAEGRDYMPDSRHRVDTVSAQITKAGTWEHAVVAYPDADGLSLIDGHHRLAALEAARRAQPDKVAERHAVWIALPKS